MENDEIDISKYLRMSKEDRDNFEYSFTVKEAAERLKKALDIGCKGTIIPLRIENDILKRVTSHFESIGYNVDVEFIGYKIALLSIKGEDNGE